MAEEVPAQTEAEPTEPTELTEELQAELGQEEATSETEDAEQTETSEPDPVLSVSLADLRKLPADERKAAYAEYYKSLPDDEKAEMPGVAEFMRRDRQRDEAAQLERQERERGEELEQTRVRAANEVIGLASHVEDAVLEIADQLYGDDSEWASLDRKQKLQRASKIDAQKIAAHVKAYADAMGPSLALDEVTAVTSEILRRFDDYGGLDEQQTTDIIEAARSEGRITRASITGAQLDALAARIKEGAMAQARLEMESEYKTRLKAERGVIRTEILKELNTEPDAPRSDASAEPPDEDRLIRLAFGQDRNGHGATEEDRAWLAARN